MRRLTVVTILLIALGDACAPTRALAAQWVSYGALLQQIRSGPVIRAVINPARSDVEIKFRNASEWEAFFPRGGQPALQRLLHERHIRVLFASRHHANQTRQAAVHHHLRYIAAGVLGAVALLGGSIYLIARRRGGRPWLGVGPGDR